MSIIQNIIEENIKICILIYLATFLVSLLQDKFSPERIRDFVKGKNRVIGYLAAVLMGIFTPFCSCSSIPIFIGFLAAGLPLGISLAFLISSPLISEIAIIILLALPQNAFKLTAFYVGFGTIISILGGWMADYFNLKRNIIFKFPPRIEISRKTSEISISIAEKIIKSHFYAWQTLKSIILYVIASVAIGCLFQYLVPDTFIMKYLQGKHWWEVPSAAIIGIPLYANHGALMPFIESLLTKNVPIGTCMTLLMSATAISFPEIIMLKKLFNYKLLMIFIIWLTTSFILTGFLLNNL